MGIIMQAMRTQLFFAALLLMAVAAVPANDDAPQELGDANDATPEVAKLQTKLAKLEHTLHRIKKSCTANDIPKLELGESADNEQKATSAQELKEKIKKKEAEIDKVA